VALSGLKAPYRFTVDVRDFKPFGVAIRERMDPVVHRPQRLEFSVRDALPGHHQHVDVAVIGVEVPKRQRAARIDAEQVAAERLQHAGDKGVNEGVNLGREGHPN
jgi:hypothetical protein